MFKAKNCSLTSSKFLQYFVNMTNMRMQVEQRVLAHRNSDEMAVQQFQSIDEQIFSDEIEL